MHRRWNASTSLARYSTTSHTIKIRCKLRYLSDSQQCSAGQQSMAAHLLLLRTLWSYVEVRYHTSYIYAWNGTATVHPLVWCRLNQTEPWPVVPLFDYKFNSQIQAAENTGCVDSIIPPPPLRLWQINLSIILQLRYTKQEKQQSKLYWCVSISLRFQTLQLRSAIYLRPSQ